MKTREVSHSGKVGARGSAAKVTIAVMLSVCVVIAIIALVVTMGSNNDIKQVQKFVDMAGDPMVSSIDINGDDLEILLDIVGAPSFDKDKDAVFRTLAISTAIDDTDIDREVVKFATKEKLAEQIRVRLFEVLEFRKGESSLPLLVDYFSNGKEKDAVIAAIDAAKPLMEKDEIIELFKLISFTDSGEVRAAAERAVRSFAESDESADLDKELAAAYKAAQKPAARNVYIRLLGIIGGSSAADIVGLVLADENQATRISGYKALENWPDDSMVKELFKGLADEDEADMKNYAFDAAVGFLTNVEEMEEKELVRYWKKAAGQAETEKQKAKFLRALGQLKARWSLPILQVFLDDENEKVSFLAEQAIERVEE